MNKASAPGSVEALERLMTRYGNDVLRMCYVMLRDVELARDAAQDSFLKAYRAMAHAPCTQNERAWLMRIAVNTCKDQRRSHWWRVIDRRVALDELPEPAADAVIPDDTLMLAVLHLPAKQRQVVLMHYYQGLTLQQIAQTLHKPASTIRSRLMQAKGALRQALKGWYDHDEWLS